MNKKTILWIGVYAAVAYGAYYMFFSKTKYAKQIIQFGNSEGSLDTLKSFDIGFLRSWANASKNNEKTFTYQGKSYNTKGGKAVK